MKINVHVVVAILMTSSAVLSIADFAFSDGSGGEAWFSACAAYFAWMVAACRSSCQ